MGVILAIDPATESGWARFVEGKYHASGEGRYTRFERDAIVAKTAALATELDCDVAIVMETWVLHGKWSNVAKQSVCESAGRWKDSLDVHALEHRVVRVQVNEWRRAVLGSGYSRAASAQLKKLAQARARAIARLRSVGHNEAEAICMAFWGLHAPDVRVLLAE